jgi:anti-sigma factor (TIGR02949 family)
MMTCEDFVPFIDAFVDGEFDERERAEMEVHLQSCDTCREQVRFQVRMKEEFKACLTEPAPEGLREQIFSGLAELSISDGSVESGPSEITSLGDVREQRSAASSSTSRAWRNAWVAAPLVAAVLLALASPSFTVAPARSDQLPVIEETVDWHRGNFPIEVTGPDASFVSQWFRNKVDFPVRTPTFGQNHDVSLLGGRIAHVQNRRAAYLLYEVDGTKVSVLVFDGDGLRVPSDKVRKIAERDVFMIDNDGYEVALLQDDGVTYTITSELPEESFVRLVRDSLAR